mmetsp:Transcript_9652/g.22323  ORF Transcript_9652/g.22323 Transcript_9652/m.22323 type:complete len:324 (-) Transcript_9652:93-1064(-)
MVGSTQDSVNGSLSCHPQAVDIGRHSNCPSDKWHDAIAPLIARPHMLMLNVGANKGYNLLEFMQRYTATALTHHDWHSLLRDASPPCKLQCCGVCIVCRRARAPQRASVVRPQLHAFELQPSNALMLQQMSNMSRVPFSVHGVAASNETGFVYTQDVASRPGYESTGASRQRLKRRSIERRAIALDDFLGGQCSERADIPCLSPDAIEKAGGRVQLVSIDTEGWDALVLHGLRRSLAAQRIDVVEFEYSRAWKVSLGESALQDTLAWLDSLGYTCFWQGNQGSLAQASGGCWLPDFYTRISHRWSNLVCTARTDILTELRSIQ